MKKLYEKDAEIDVETDLFVEGDWVVYKLTGKKGVIEKGFGGGLHIFNTIEGIMNKESGWATNDKQLEKLPMSIYPSDINLMIDIALLTNDKSWFAELSQQVTS